MEPNQEQNTQVKNVGQEHFDSNTGQNNIAIDSMNSSGNTKLQGAPTKKNRKTGVILRFVLLFLIAASGVGFGVWAMMDGDAKTKQLEAQVDLLKEQNSKLSSEIERLEEKNASTDDREPDIDSDTTEKDNFFIVDEFNIKVKLPNDISINRTAHGENGYCGPYISILEVIKDGQTLTADEGFGYITKCPLSSMHPYAYLAYTYDGYNYYYESANGGFDDEPRNEIVKILKKIFVDSDNYASEE